MGSELPAILTHDDHARGCQGREYACTCGYDDRIAAALSAQEEQIDRLKGIINQLYVDVQAARDEAIEGSKRDG